MGFAGFLGCAAEDDVESLDQGLTIISADPAVGVVGAFRQGDHVVYFETAVGYMKPQIIREAYPDEPAREIDMRFVDQNGLPFFVQRGGDEFIDPTWNEGIKDTFSTPVDAADRALDFELAQAAGQAFPVLAKPELADHIFHLRAYGERMLPSQDVALADAAVAAENARPDDDDVAYANWSKTGSWYLAGGMSHSSVAVFGTHGSVQLHAYQSSWVFQLNMCNHGSCTGSHKCFTYSNGWLSNPSINYESSTSTGTVSGGCSSSYHWDGGSGKHNSNDDTAYEMWQTLQGTPNTAMGNSSTFSWDATNKHYQCNGNNGRWTAPANCPTAAQIPAAMCTGSCGGYSSANSCYCDSSCASYGDCCSDGSAASVCGY